jgi:predicted transglutaminase-like cysteine proteinase
MKKVLLTATMILFTTQAYAAPMCQGHIRNIGVIKAEIARVKPYLYGIDSVEKNLTDRELWSVARKVNQEVNSTITYQEDKEEHFQIPSETIKRGKGDCEDFAILKYSLLRKQGVPADRLKIILFKRVGGGLSLGNQEDHAVLAVKRDDDTIYLDNRYSEPKGEGILSGLEVVAEF